MNRAAVSQRVIDKAAGLRKHLQQDQDHQEVWQVRSGESLYRVQVGGAGDERWATCSCRYGRNNSYRIGCAHVLAVIEEIDSRSGTSTD